MNFKVNLLIIWILLSIVIVNSTYSKTNACNSIRHKGDNWSITIPESWRKFPNTSKNIQLHLIGDGMDPIPAIDATISPLQVGVIIENYAKEQKNITEFTSELIIELEKSNTHKLRRKCDLKEIALLDGTKAIILNAAINRLDNNRHSIYHKIITKDAKGNLYTVTGFLAFGIGCENFVKNTGIDEFLTSIITTFTFTKSTEIGQNVEIKCNKISGDITRAISLANEANNLIGNNDVMAIDLFSQSIKLCNHISFAHNGLAWVLITTNNGQLKDFKTGLEHAIIAVSQTEELDASIIDTLAKAYFLSGNTNAAIETIKKAIKLEPENGSFKEKLKEYQKGNK